jgi:hypothetical protein
VLSASIIALMMEAASASETSVKFYQTTMRYNPVDSHLHTRRRENLKSYKIIQLYKSYHFILLPTLSLAYMFKVFLFI